MKTIITFQWLALLALFGCSNLPAAKKAKNTKDELSGDTTREILADNAQIRWQKRIGGIKNDFAGSAIATRDGGYVVVGSTGVAPANSSDNPGRYNFLIEKLNANGQTIWTRRFDEPADTRGDKVIELPDGGFLIAGSTFLDLRGMRTGEMAQSDGHIMRLDKEGNQVWQRLLSGNRDDIISAICISNKSEIILAGTSESSKNGIIGPNHGGRDAWVVKLSLDGELTWSKNYGGGRDDIATAMVVNEAGEILVTGFTTSYYSGVPASRLSNSDAFVFKLDATGKQLWWKNLESNGEEEMRAMIAGSNNEYFLAGHINESVPGSGYQNDFRVIKINDEGKIIWRHSYGSKNNEIAFCLATGNDSSLLIGGTHEPMENELGTGMDDFYIIQIDSKGILMGDLLLELPGIQTPRSVIAKADNSFVIAGEASAMNEKEPGYGYLDIWILKIKGEALSVK